MDYKRIVLENNVGLNIISTDKFKTGFLSMNFIRPLDKAENTKNALLVQVLRRGFKGFESQRDINLELSKNYGSRLETLVRKRGECQILGFYSVMINNSFAFFGENIFKDAVNLLERVMFEPLVKNGAFVEEYVESEKRNLKNYIAARINDKVSYSVLRATQEMCEGEPYALSEYGNANDVDKITPKELYEHYKFLVREAKLEIFYVGNIAPDEVKGAFKYVDTLPVRNTEDIHAPYVTGEVSGVKNIEEKLDVAQGKLCIGCRTGIVEGDRLYPALVVANAIFGGTPVSKLFMNVREKLSLCYYVRSRIDKLKGVMIIAAGIENKNLKVTMDEIEIQLLKLKQGEITEDELNAARAALRTSINSMMDYAYQTEDYYITKALNGDTSSPYDLLEKIDNVTISEIVEAAKCIKYDTVYFLRGTAEGEENE